MYTRYTVAIKRAAQCNPECQVLLNLTYVFIPHHVGGIIMKAKIQSFGRFLSGMVMPNIGAFIAWGLITALFIPSG